MAGYSGKIDAVFEGGGVKGIGLVGAVAATEAQGCRFENVAGTSAGAIVAALVAAGYNAAQLKEILDDLDYMKFKDPGLTDKIPILGPMLSVALEKGIYEGDFFENWLRELLAAKGVRTFKDLIIPEYAEDPRYRYRLQVIAADLTHCRMLILPGDIRHYGMDPDELDVAHAVRMSMSIPFFFEPVVRTSTDGKPCYIVDGGVLSNFPMWIFDAPAGQNPEWPTIGFKLVEGAEEKSLSEGRWVRRWEIRGPVSMLGALFSTMMEAHDALYIEDREFARTIPIPTVGVGTTEFDLATEKAARLYASGMEVGAKFWGEFDFEKWKEQYRNSAPKPRSERVLS